MLRPEAFEAIQRGDKETHNRILLEEIDRLSSKVDSIVMAQLSMSALEPFLGKTAVPVYNSGTTGFDFIRHALYGSAVPAEVHA